MYTPLERNGYVVPQVGEAKSCVVTRVLCGREFCGVTSFFRVRTCVRPQTATTCGWATRCVGLRVVWPTSSVEPPVVAGQNLLGPTRSVTERLALCGSPSCMGPCVVWGHGMGGVMNGVGTSVLWGYELCGATSSV